MSDHQAVHPPTDPVVVAMFKELAQVQGQLTAITAMIANNHNSTNQRIDDLRHSIEGRLGGVEGRVGTLEKNERSTAIRVAGIAAGSSAVVAAGIEVARQLFAHR